MADILRYIELVEETAYAPATPYLAAGSKSVYLDPRSMSMDSATEADAIVESAFGRAPGRKYAGFYNPSGDFAFNANVRNMAHILKWVLGGYAFTAGSPVTNPNIHEAWGADVRTLPSVQGRFGKDQFEHLFQGMIFDTLTLEVEDELTICTIESSAAKDGKASLQTAASVLTKLPTEIEIPFHAVTATINGVVQAAKVKNLSLSIANNIDAEAGRYLGSRYAGRIPANERETTLSMEMDFSDTTEIERLWGGATGPAASGATTFPCVLTFFGGNNASAVAQNMTITLPKFFYTAVGVQPEGRDEATQSIEGRALATSQTLNDGTTSVVTDIYAKTLSMQAAVAATTT
jgi:hypothetical protein